MFSHSYIPFHYTCIHVDTNNACMYICKHNYHMLHECMHTFTMILDNLLWLNEQQIAMWWCSDTPHLVWTSILLLKLTSLNYVL